MFPNVLLETEMNLLFWVKSEKSQGKKNLLRRTQVLTLLCNIPWKILQECLHRTPLFIRCEAISIHKMTEIIAVYFDEKSSLSVFNRECVLICSTTTYVATYSHFIRFVYLKLER